MRRRVLIGVLLHSVFLVASAFAAPSKNISAMEAFQMLKENSEVYLLDVRTPGEYMEVRIDGAHLIPIDQLLRRLSELPRERPVLVYCAVGSRSSQVANYLARQGFPEVYNLYGGIWGWQLRKLPVLTGRP